MHSLKSIMPEMEIEEAQTQSGLIIPIEHVKAEAAQKRLRTYQPKSSIQFDNSFFNMEYCTVITPSNAVAPKKLKQTNRLIKDASDHSSEISPTDLTLLSLA